MSASYCSNCGQPLAAGATFCSSCGAPVASGFHASVSSSAQGTSGNAIASLVLGIASFVVFPLVPAILAVILGRKAKREIAARPGLGGEGMASAGVVLGWIGIALGAFAVFFVVVIALGTMSHANP